MANFLLIHGAWHGAWVWDELRPQLYARGHTSVAIDLPSHGTDSTPPETVSLSDYTENIIQNAQSGDILVCHSMAGIPGSHVAEQIPDIIAKLVYLCAFAPKNGESLRQISEPFKDRPLTSAMVPTSREGAVGLDTSKLRDIFYTGCTDQQIATAISRLNLQPTQPQVAQACLTDDNFGRVEKHYILCEKDNAILPEMQEQMVCEWPEERVHRLEAGHSPFFSHPIELANILCQILEEKG